MKKRNASSKARMGLNRLIHKMRKEEKMGENMALSKKQ